MIPTRNVFRDDAEVRGMLRLLTGECLDQDTRSAATTTGYYLPISSGEAQLEDLSAWMFEQKAQGRTEFQSIIGPSGISVFAMTHAHAKALAAKGVL